MCRVIKEVGEVVSHTLRMVERNGLSNRGLSPALFHIIPLKYLDDRGYYFLQRKSLCMSEYGIIELHYGMWRSQVGQNLLNVMCFIAEKQTL